MTVRYVRAATGAAVAALLVLVASLLAPSAAPGAERAQAEGADGGRPHVLVITLDDMRWDELRYMPQMRRLLARRGISFANSFAPNPLCCPSRASFLLEQYSHQHHVLSHEPPYGFASLDDRRTLAGRLRRAGYRTGFVGKYLNGYGYQRSRVTGRSSRTYVPPGWDDWRAGVELRGSVPNRVAGGTYAFFSFTQNENGHLVGNRGRYSSAVIADDAIQFMRKNAAGRKPWFLWVNVVAPHHGAPREADDPRSFTAADGRLWGFPTPARPRGVKGMYDRVLRHAPGIPADGRPSEADMRDKPHLGYHAEPPAAVKRALAEVQRQRAESLRASDRELARVLRTLRETGQQSRTVVVLTSDNGYLMGEHRVALQKIWAYEESIRVPLVVAGPGIRRGVRYAPAMTHDVTATVLDLAKAGHLPGGSGRSLLPVLRGPDSAWDRAVLTEGYWPGMRRRVRLPAGLSTSGLRTGRWKYVRYSSGASELYDLASDPLEMQNLARDPDSRPMLRRMKEVWEMYADCAGAACRARLPSDLVVTPAELRAIASHANSERLAHYGPPTRSP